MTSRGQLGFRPIELKHLRRSFGEACTHVSVGTSSRSFNTYL